MQHDTCTKILETNGFKLDKALNSPMMQNSKKFKNTYNHIYVRN